MALLSTFIRIVCEKRRLCWGCVNDQAFLRLHLSIVMSRSMTFVFFSWLKNVNCVENLSSMQRAKILFKKCVARRRSRGATGVYCMPIICLHFDVL